MPLVVLPVSRSSRWSRYTSAAVSGRDTLDSSGPDPARGSDGRGGPSAAGRPAAKFVNGLRSGTSAWIASFLGTSTTNKKTDGRAGRSAPGKAPATTAGTDIRPSTELRLVPVAVCAWAGAAAAIRLPGPVTLVGAAAAGLLLLLFLLVAWRGPRLGHRSGTAAALAPLAVLVLVASSAGSAAASRTAGPAGAAVAEEASITGEFVASGDARAAAADRFSGKPRYLLEAELRSFTRAGERSAAALPVLIIGDESYADIHLGDRLTTAGTLHASEPGDRTAALLRASRAPAIQPAGGLAGLATGLRTGFADRARTLGASDAAGLLPGMVLGDRSAAPPDLTMAMQDTGLTHLTAVSGANCSYLLAFIFLLSRLVRLPRGWAAAAAILALAGFVLVVRPDASVLRAAVMGSIGTAAILSGRGKVPAALLCLCATVLLVVDPWLSGSYAFILSVCATAGLIFLGPQLTAGLARFLPQPVAVLTAVPLAAQVACSPVLILLQPNLPAYSLPANIAAAPVVPFVTIVGMGAVLVGYLFPPLDYPLLLASGAGAGWVAGVARFFAQAPGALLPWLPGPVGAAAMAAAAALLAFGIIRLGRPPGDPDPDRARNRGRTSSTSAAPGREPTRHRGRRFAAAASAAIVVLVLAVVFIRLVQPDPSGQNWVAAACDVGQGDALAVRTGPHSAMLIDAGPDPPALDSCLDRLDVRTIDLLVISHVHTDHYAGAGAAGDGRKVQALAFSSAVTGIPPEIAELSKDLGVRPERLNKGGHGEFGGVRWEVLWPPATGAAAEPAGSTADLTENDSSAVLLVRTSGLNLLFTGDIEEDAARQMLRSSPELRAEPVHVLKVAHHGARNSGRALPEELRPLLALISVGEENTYGHPAAETLGRLESAGAEVARTDQLGSFILHIQGERLLVSPFAAGW